MRRRVNERLAGRTIRCPGCEQPLTIPELAIPEPARDHEEVADEIEIVSDEVTAVEVQAVEVASVVPTARGANVNLTKPSGLPAAIQTAAAVASPTIAVANNATANAVAPHHVPEHPPSALLHDEADDELPPRKQRDDGELDMTPMVDVTFLLLIFFMVTASFSLQKSIQMPKQNSDLPSMSNVEEETEELDPIELEIEENGGFLVLAPDWERETPGKQNLISALKQALGANKDGMRLDIKVHENAKLQMLVDAMDAGTIAGFTEIQVAEVDGFD
jgi:biopolymer transport protein ExbD